MSAFEVLALNTSIPQIQAAQAGDSYVMVVNATTPALRITQTGTGNAISVEDSANPDSSPFVVTATGDVGIGTSTPGQKLTVDGVVASIGPASVLTASSAFLDYNTTLNLGRFAAVGNTTGAAAPLYFSQYSSNASVARDAMIIDASGNLGLGVTPKTDWSTDYKAMQFGASGALSSHTSTSLNFTILATNQYVNSAGTSKFINDGYAPRYLLRGDTGEHYWYTTNTSTAGQNVTNTQAMTLDASGNLGVGATSPNNKLTVQADATGASFADNGVAQIIARGNTDSTKRLGLGIDTTNNIGVIQAQKFGTSTYPLAINPAGGNVLVGTTDAAQGSGNGNKLAAGGAVWVVNAATADGFSYYNSSAAAYRFYVSSAGTISATNTTISAISDQRLKENIQDLDVGLNAVMALKPRKFDWKAGKGKDIKGDRGWIAQEFEQVFPDMIDEWKDPAPEGEEPYKSVRADLIPVMVKAIQELKAEVDSLKAQLEAK